MVSDFDIAISASITALLISMGQFAQAAVALGLSLALFVQNEG